MNDSGQMGVSHLHPPNVVLAVGGLDPTGGAGVLRDCSAILSCGCHGAAVCSVLTVQDGISFGSVYFPPAGIVRASIEAVMGVQRVTAIKIGAVGSSEVADELCEVLGRPGPPIVLDPVFASTSGGRLSDSESEEIVVRRLLPMCELVTPNLSEAEVICGFQVNDASSMERAALDMVAKGARYALVKGGHLESDPVDVLAGPEGSPRTFTSPRLDVGEVRGTGCALASMAAANIALGHSVENAVEEARRRLIRAMEVSISVGQGPRVLNFT